MTFEEALEVLQISETASAKEARRAYLKLVKQHKPERDPVGFQRVREAYDSVKDIIEWRGALSSAASENAVESELGPTERTAQPLPVLATSEAPIAPVMPLATEPLQSSEGELPAAVDSQAEPELSTYHEQAGELEADQAGKAVEIWRSALERYPDSPEARWELVDAHNWNEDHLGATEAIAEGYRRGLPGFAAALLVRAPLEAPPELLKKAKSDSELALAAAAGLVQARRAKQALPYLSFVLSQGLEADQLEVHADVFVDAIAQLAASSNLEHCKKLAELWRATLSAEADHRSFGGIAAARWLLLRELLAVSDELPTALFRSLAGSIDREDPDVVSAELSGYARRNPGRAKRARKLLQRRAPALFAAYSAQMVAERQNGFTPGWGLAWPLVLLALQIGRCMTRDDDTSAMTRDSVQQAIERAERTRAANTLPSMVPPPLAAPGGVNTELVKDVSQRIIDLASDLELTELAQSARQVQTDFHLKCDVLTPSFSELVTLSRDKDAELTTQVQLLWGEFIVACPGHAGEVVEP